MTGYEDAVSRIRSAISIGYESVYIFTAMDLADKQRGYSIGSCGEDLSGEADGDWRKEWIAIGYEGSRGDPIFIDTATEGCPVYTAWHGEGRWDPKQVAISLHGLRETLEIMARVSQGREDPARVAENPISSSEREAVLREIRQFNRASTYFFGD